MHTGVRSSIFASLAALLVLFMFALAEAGSGTKTITSVTDNGNGSYKLVMASSSAVTVGDHFGARITNTSGPGGLWEVMSKPDGTSVIVSETLTQENGSAFGVPIAGDAWYATPTTMGRSRIPHLAKAYDAALRRNAYLDGTVAGGGTGGTTASAARTNLGLAIGTDVQAYDAQLASLAGLSYSGNALKVVRVNAGETAFEVSTVSGGGETLAQTLALGADGNQVDISNVGSVALAANKRISLNGVVIMEGAGSPEGSIPAPVGSIYSRNNGSTGTSLYIKESGTGNTGWVAVAPGSGNVVDTLAATLGAGADGNGVDQTNLGGLTLAADKSVTTSGTGDLVAGDDLTVGDDATVTDALGVNGNTTLGNGTGDTVTISGPLSVNGGVGTADYYLASGGAGAVMQWKVLPSSGTVVTGTANGRLTASSSLSVTTTDTASSTLYYLPHSGNQIALYNGSSAWAYHTIPDAGVSLTIDGSLTADQTYDIYIRDVTGTLTLSATAWSTHTAGTGARGASPPVLQNGVYVETGALTRRYLGTIRVKSNGATEEVWDKVGFRLIWNVQNRVMVSDFANEDTNSWTSSGTDGTWAAVNGGDATWKSEYVVGLDMPVSATMWVYGSPNTTLPAAAVAVNGTTPDRAVTSFASLSNAGSGAAFATRMAPAGYHYWQGVETSNNSGGSQPTFFGDNNNAAGGGSLPVNSGMHSRGER